MATLYIAEYSGIAVPGPEPHGFQAPQEPSLDQTLAISGAPAASTVFAATTRMVRLHTDATCSVVFGLNPVAATGNKRLAANQTEYFGVPAGAGWKVSVVTNA